MAGILQSTKKFKFKNLAFLCHIMNSGIITLIKRFQDNHPNIWMKRNQQLQDNKSVKQEMQPSDKTGPKSPYVVQNITNSPLLSGGSDYMTLRESPSQLLLTRTRKKPSNPKGNRLSSIGFNPEQLLIRYDLSISGILRDRSSKYSFFFGLL